MIRFVIKMAFFLGLIAMLVPGGTSRDGEPEINLFAVLYGAQAAMSDLSNFCERAPSACAAGGDVARFAGERVSDGLALAYDFVDDAVSKRRRDEPEAARAMASKDASPQSLPQAPVPAAKARDEAAAARADAITTAAIMARATSRLIPNHPMAPSTTTTGKSVGTMAARPSFQERRKMDTRMKTRPNAMGKLRSCVAWTSRTQSCWMAFTPVS